jgi:glyoxylase-like metal-dependent hydrolase (beta-lactamase superfamily II)
MPLARRPLLGALAALLLPAAGKAQGTDATPPGLQGRVFLNAAGGVRIHTYMAGPQGALVTSHVIETADGLVLVDGQFTPASAAELRTYLGTLGRPVTKVFLSHAHPDHWFGFHHLGRPAVHAGPVTARFIETQGANLVAERRADSAAPSIAGIVTEGTETIGGVTLRHRLVADTEAPEMLLIEVPQAGALIVQDLFYNRVHAVVSRTLPTWIAALESVAARGAGTPLILAGHGEPASPARLAELVRYLRAVQPLMAGAPNERERIVAIATQMERDFPDYRARPLLELGLSRSLGQ